MLAMNRGYPNTSTDRDVPQVTSAPAFFTAPIDLLALEFAKTVTVATPGENKLDWTGRFTKRAEVQRATQAKQTQQ